MLPTALSSIVHDLLDAREGRISLLQEALEASGNLTREFQARYREAERARAHSDEELARVKRICDCQSAEGLRQAIVKGSP